MIVPESGCINNIPLKSMRLVSILPIVTLLLMLTGCVSVPVWESDVATLDKKGIGLTISEVDKVLGRSSVLASRIFEVEGTTYTLRHYEISEPTGRVISSYDCKRNSTDCMSNFSPEHKLAPFFMIFVGIPPKLVAWGKLDALSKSTDPQVIAVLRQLKRSYADYQLLQSNPGVRCEIQSDGDCLMRNK